MAIKKSTILEIKERAESDLWYFANLVNPTYIYGDIHEKVFRWLTAPDARKRMLLLLPRGHLKSHCIAVWAAWEITRNPWTTMVYLSAQDELAKQQCGVIKNILSSDVYRRYWPEMIKQRESERSHWSAYSFNTDHPIRAYRSVRDHTVIAKTIKSNFVGLHADHIIYDDVVVDNNAYTEGGRADVDRALSQCSSVLNPGGTIKAVGTRYHPKDAYDKMITSKTKIWNELTTDWVGEDQLYDVMEEKVENNGDGTGVFLWPRTVSNITGASYGFNIQELELIRAEYMSKGQQAQFYAQYYNDPNDESTNLLDRSVFKYYDPKFINITMGSVKFKENKLNIFAAMDVAWTEATVGSTKYQGDYTAIAVIGIDKDNYIYILDLARFKTSNFQVYYDNVISLANKWGFRKITIETNAGGKFVAQEIESLSRRNGGLISVDTKSNSGFGIKSKIMRQYAIVNPKYELGMIFHRRDGLFSVLEEEIVLERPPHDDLVDALGMAIEKAKPPMKQDNVIQITGNVVTDSRFGGRIGR